MSRDDDDSRNEGVDIVVENVEKRTELAALCRIRQDRKTRDVWIPLSQLQGGDEPEEDGGKIVLTIPRWLAEEKELV